MHSLFAIFTAGLSCLAGVTSAYTTPVGNPSGNPIYKPGLNELVPIGQPYTITWNPTTEGTITLVLLRGPSENIKPLYPIAEGIPNSGQYVWTPASDLEPDTTHYGLQLIVDKTGQYQWSTQFGLKAAEGSLSSSSSSSHPATVTGAAYTSTTSSTASTNCSTTSSTSCSTTSSTMPYANSTTITSCTASTSKYTASTGWPVHNSTIISPTKSMTVPSSLKTSTRTPEKTTSQSVKTSSAAITSYSPTTVPSTGAAARLVGGAAAGLLGVVAAFAL